MRMFILAILKNKKVITCLYCIESYKNTEDVAIDDILCVFI